MNGEPDIQAYRESPSGQTGKVSAPDGRLLRRVAYAMSVTLLLGVTAAFTLMSWQNAVERQDRELSAVVVMGATGINTYFATLEKALAGLGEALRKAGPGPDAHPLLAEFKAKYPEFQIVGITMMDGENVASSEAPATGKNPNLSAQPSFIDARERLQKGERMVVSRPFFGLVTRTWLTHLRYGVRDGEGRLLFMLVAGLAQERTHAFWKDTPLPPGAGMGLVRDDMYAVARHPLPKQRSATMFSEPATGLLPDYLRAHAFPVRGTVRGISAVTGAGATVNFQRLADYPLTFFINNPQSNLRAEWWSSAWTTYVLILLLFGGGVAIIAWAGRRQAAWQAEREARVGELESLTTRLRDANAGLESANAELEAFTYTVSHDLRAPIRAIDGYSAIVQRRLANSADAETADLLTRIRASVARMADLLTDLLNLSRRSRQELRGESLNTRAEVDAVIAELGVTSATARIEIADLPPCYGDSQLLRQVWSNLISNALKYSANQPDPVVRIGFENGEYFVADNGVGFDMAYADKLFHVFSRLHAEPDYPGTGVGLAIVKRIVLRHGGTARAAAAPGKGARFSFSLPAVPAVPAVPADAPN